ncbi:hypothetical protein B0G77_3276 [Paraburkholderia sp. BL10I2N1]|nr:hypothetical protein B0G77_3276 [Paraburkholderia sp. BL10I2N1]
MTAAPVIRPQNGGVHSDVAPPAVVFKVINPC